MAFGLSSAKTHRSFRDARADNSIQSFKRAAANEKNIFCIESNQFLFRMFTSSLRRQRRDGSFENFQQSLLDAFTRLLGYDDSAHG